MVDSFGLVARKEHPYMRSVMREWENYTGIERRLSGLAKVALDVAIIAVSTFYSASGNHYVFSLKIM